MSHSSHTSIWTLPFPYNTTIENLALCNNYSSDTNPGFYHLDNTPNALGPHPSAFCTSFSGSSQGSTGDTRTVHSSEPPIPSAPDLYANSTSPHLFPRGMSGDAMFWAPSNEPWAEHKSSPLTPLISEPPKRAPSVPTAAPTFLDIKGILLPMISLHVQEAVGPTGRRQWYCTFPHCAHSPFSRRDRAEIHVANVHLNEKRIYCNGSCGTAGCLLGFASMENLRAHIKPARSQCQLCRIRQPCPDVLKEPPAPPPDLSCLEESPLG